MPAVPEPASPEDPVPKVVGAPVSEEIFRTARLHRIAAGALLRATGLYPGQEVLMMQLWEHGEQRQSDLIKVLGLDSSTVTKMLQRMEQAGFVTRRRAEMDRRVVLVSATRAGQALRAQVEAAWRELEALTVADMTPEEQATAMKVLNRFAQNLAAGQSGASQSPTA
ncbi:MarR family winged helix-turn-helix transcriptional regulator [Streptomyces sp. NPDC054887]